MTSHGIDPHHQCHTNSPPCLCAKTLDLEISGDENNCHDYDYESLPATSSFTTHMAAGALAGIAEHSFMYPLDSIKTRMQYVSNTTEIYNSMKSTIKYIRRQESLRTLWRGISSVIVGAGPAHSLYFATYEQCKEIFGANRSGQHLFTTATSGALATVIHDTLMNPFDVVKQRMQMHGSSFRNIWHCGTHLLKFEGVRSFYISLPTTLTMTIPFQSIHFASYEFLRKKLNPSQKYHPQTHLVAGASAGACAAAFTTPLDVVKTLLQTKGNHSDIMIRQCEGFFPALQYIWYKEGVAGFFRGIKPRILTHMPSTAICWSTYEFFKWHITSSEMTHQSKLSHQQQPPNTLNIETPFIECSI